MTGNELRKQMEVLLQQLGIEEQLSLKDSTILRAYRTFNYMQQMSEKNLDEAYHKIPMAEKSGYLKCLPFADLAAGSQAMVDAYNLFTSLTLQDILQYVLPRFAANIPEVMAALSAYTTSIAVGITLMLKIKIIIYRDDSQELKGMSVFAIYEKQFPQKVGSRGYLDEKCPIV